MEHASLLLIDVQNDFCPGGTLAVTKGDEVVPVLNRYISYFASKNAPIFASRDWHPEKTDHFQEWGGLWPPHCVQNTKGAAFHTELAVKNVTIVSKGMDPKADSYSAFQGENSSGVLLGKLLKEQGIKTLYIGGLATDYCVKASVLDALKEGFQVKVLLDAVRAVNLSPGDGERALEEMVRNKAETMTIEHLT